MTGSQGRHLCSWSRYQQEEFKQVVGQDFQNLKIAVNYHVAPEGGCKISFGEQEEEARLGIIWRVGGSPRLLSVGFWSPLLSLGFPDCTSGSCRGRSGGTG